MNDRSPRLEFEAKESAAMATRTHANEASRVADQSRKVLRDVQDLGSIAVDQVGRSARRLKRRGRDVVAAGRERVVRAETQLEDFIVRHPVKALLVALGVGAILGLTMRRRN
jgi:ElaB/YqjD/DUF883 family membrane-anchored ribosome-binding protein